MGKQTYSSERILIATGGWPSIPDFPGNEYVISSNETFYLETLPEKILIVGGGYIAVEFAGIFHGLGVETTQSYRGPLFLRGFDEDIRLFLAQEMRKKGVEILFKSNIDRIEKKGDKFIAYFSNGEHRQTDLVMYAITLGHHMYHVYFHLQTKVRNLSRSSYHQKQDLML